MTLVDLGSIGSAFGLHLLLQRTVRQLVNWRRRLLRP